MRNRLRVAIADGNWSDPSIWNDNSVPEERDIVALNGQHVVLDQDAEVYGFYNNVQQPINSYTYLTFNDEPEGIAESSDNSPLAWQSFTSSNSYRNVPGVSDSNPYWVSYEYPNQELILLKAYQFNGYSDNHPFNPTSWLFQAWDGTSWITLDDRTNYGANYSTFIGDLSSNTVAYYKYRFYVTALAGGVNYTAINLGAVRFWEDKSYLSNSIDGGDLTINDSKTFTVSGPAITGANYDLIYCNANIGSVVNLNLSIQPHTGDRVSITINGTGEYNLTGNILGDIIYYSRYGRQIRINQPCILNVIGDIRGGAINNTDRGISVAANGTIVNVVGNLYSGGGINSYAISLGAATELTVTGDVYGAVRPVSYGGGGIYCNNSDSNITIVGNVYGGGITNYAYDHFGISVPNANSLTITGNIYTIDGDRNYGVYMSTLPTLSIVGILQSSSNHPAIYSVSTLINNYVLSGPFVCSNLGTIPFTLRNFKIIPSFNNYFQFKDSVSESGLFTMVSADTVVDSPAQEDVREGTVFFMFNPFGYKTVEKIINNIEESLKSNPRKIRVIYCGAATPYISDKYDWLNEEILPKSTRIHIWSNKL